MCSDAAAAGTATQFGIRTKDCNADWTEGPNFELLTSQPGSSGLIGDMTTPCASRSTRRRLCLAFSPLRDGCRWHREPGELVDGGGTATEASLARAAHEETQDAETLHTTLWFPLYYPYISKRADKRSPPYSSAQKQAKQTLATSDAGVLCSTRC